MAACPGDRHIAFQKQANVTACLARAGLCQVHAIAAHGSRFERVDGGWRPHAQPKAQTCSEPGVGFVPGTGDRKRWESQSPMLAQTPVAAPQLDSAEPAKETLAGLLPKVPVAKLKKFRPPHHSPGFEVATRFKATDSKMRREPRASRVVCDWTTQVRGGEKRRLNPVAYCSKLAQVVTEAARSERLLMAIQLDELGGEGPADTTQLPGEAAPSPRPVSDHGVEGPGLDLDAGGCVDGVAGEGPAAVLIEVSTPHPISSTPSMNDPPAFPDEYEGEVCWESEGSNFQDGLMSMSRTGSNRSFQGDGQMSRTGSNRSNQGNLTDGLMSRSGSNRSVFDGLMSQTPSNRSFKANFFLGGNRRLVAGSCQSSARNSFISVSSSTVGRHTLFLESLQQDKCVRAVRAAEAELDDTGSFRERRKTREALYASILVTEDDTERKAVELDIGSQDFAEIAQTFAELDDNVEGSVEPHVLQTLLRRMGRNVPARTLSDLLMKLWERTPKAFQSRSKEQTLTQNVNFSQILETFGMVFHGEQSDLKCFLMEVGHGIVDIHAVADFLKDMEFRFEPSIEVLKRAAAELGIQHGGNGSTITLKKDEMLFKLVERCRTLEKLRVRERACFNALQVDNFSKAFEMFATVEGELSPEDFLPMLQHLGIEDENRADEDELEEQWNSEIERVKQRDDRDTISFNECLHLVRRCFDQAEVQAVLLERSAQDFADLSTEDIEELRKVYEMFAEEEEEEEQHEFNYFALTKAVRFLGWSLPMDQSAALEKVFRRYAKPSKMTHRENEFYLPFPEFVKLVHELCQTEEFPGIFRLQTPVDEECTSPGPDTTPVAAAASRGFARKNSSRFNSQSSSRFNSQLGAGIE